MPFPGRVSNSQPELGLPYAADLTRTNAQLKTTSTLSTPSGLNPAYGDAFISPPSIDESPDPLNLISPVSSVRGGNGRARQVSPSPKGSWFSSQSRSLSGLEQAMGDTMTPTVQSKRKAGVDETPSKRHKGGHQGPSPVKVNNFYSVRPKMQLPPQPSVEGAEIVKSPPVPSSVESRMSIKRGRGRPKGSKSKHASAAAGGLPHEHHPRPSPSVKLASEKKPSKPKAVKKTPQPRPTTFTSSLPLALPEGFDSDSAEEWDKDGTFEIDDGDDSDFDGPSLSQSVADIPVWQTPDSKSTLSGRDAPTTSVIKNAQRRSVLAKLAEFIEDALEAESNLPDSNEYLNGISQLSASFFAIIDDTAILKPAQLQRLGKLIRSCATLKPGMQVPKKDESLAPESLRSIHDFDVGDLHKLLRMLSAVVRVGESVDPFRSATSHPHASAKGSTSKPAKKIASTTRRSPSDRRSSRDSPSDDEEGDTDREQDNDGADVETPKARASEELATPPLTSPPQKRLPGTHQPVKVSEEDQRVLVEQLSRTSTSLMAVDCCLSLLSVPHLDQSLLSEDVIRPCFDVLRSALELIVYPFVEACSSIGITTTHPLLAAWIETIAPIGSETRRRGKKQLSEAEILTSSPAKGAQDSKGIFAWCVDYLSRIFKTCCSSMGQASKLVNLPSMSLSESIIFSAIYAGMGAFFAIEPELLSGTSDAAKVAARGRAAMDALASGSGGGGTVMKLLRLPALNLLRVIFARHVDQREWIIEELLTSLTKLPDMKKNRRQHILQDGNAINSITALLLQLIQTAAHGIRERVTASESRSSASGVGAAIQIATAAQARTQADGSDVDEEEEAIPGSAQNSLENKTSYELSSLRHAIDGPTQAAQAVSSFLMARISPAKVTKSSSDFSYASVMENLVSDLLACVFLPEWPAAALLLSSICQAFNVTIHDPKSTPDARGVALEHTGHIAAHMRQSRVKMKNRQPTAESQAQGATTTVFPLGEIERNGDVDSLNDLNNFYMTVLDFLSAAEADDGMSRSASDFLLSQWGSEMATSLIRTSRTSDAGLQRENGADGTGSPDLQQTFLSALHQSLLLLSRYSKETSESQQNNVFGVELSGSYDDIKGMAEQLVHTTSFTVRFDGLCHLLIESLSSETVSNRTKALRGLTAIYDVDAGLLKLPPIRKAIETSLTDGSAGVREAAVILLSKYLLSQPDDCQALYEQLKERSFDTGLAVRKRTLKLLASLYRILPSMSMRIDACLRVVRCVGDEDVGIREMAISILGDFWLKLGSEDREESPKRGSDELSKNDDDEATQLARELGDDVSIIVSVASQIRDKPSPIEEVFRRFGKADSTEWSDKLGQRLRALTDLLIEQLTDDAMCDASNSDSTEVLARIKTIDLIISTNPAVLSIGKAKSLLPLVKTTQAKTAEDSAMVEMLLRVFRVSLPLMPKTALAFANQLEALLRAMLNSPPMNTAALQEVVACYATVIRSHTHNFMLLVKAMASLLKALRNVSARLLQSPDSVSYRKSCMIMSEAALVCEYADVETLVKERPELERDARAACGPRPVQEQIFELLLDIRLNSPAYSAMALQNIGVLFRGFPALMEVDQGKAVMASIFASGQANDREILLRVFSDFLAAEEKKNAMEEAKQQAMEARNAPSTAKNSALGKDSGKVNMKELVGDTDTFAASSVSSNLVAQYVDGILQASLAIETPMLQRVAMDVLSSIVLQGLTHPYQCVPTLVCLETVENRQVAKRARRLHEHLWSKHGTLLAPLGTRHVQATFEFQAKLHKDQPQNLRGYRMDAALSMPTALLHPWYSLLRDKRQTRLDFVRGACKLLDIDTSSSECSEETVLLSRYVADNLATLDYKTVEEVFVVIRELQRILAVTGVQVKSCGEAFIKGLRETVPRSAMVPCADPIEAAGASEGNATLDGIDFGDGDDAEESRAVSSEPASQGPQDEVGPYTQEMLAMAVDQASEEKQSAAGTARMSIAMGTALLLRNHLKWLYGLSESRCNKYVPGKKQSAGADRPAAKKTSGGEPLSFDAMPLALDSVSSTPVAIEQLLRFEDLMNAEGTLAEDADEWQPE